VSCYFECVSFIGVKCVSTGTNEFYSQVFRCVTLAGERTRDEVDGHHKRHFSKVELKELTPLKFEVCYCMLTGCSCVYTLTVVILFWLDV